MRGFYTNGDGRSRSNTHLRVNNGWLWHASPAPDICDCGATLKQEMRTLVGLDQDASALDIAERRLAATGGGRDLNLHCSNFRCSSAMHAISLCESRSVLAESCNSSG